MFKSVGSGPKLLPGVDPHTSGSAWRLVRVACSERTSAFMPRSTEGCTAIHKSSKPDSYSCASNDSNSSSPAVQVWAV
jgi:hypothetical protein